MNGLMNRCLDEYSCFYLCTGCVFTIWCPFFAKKEDDCFIRGDLPLSTSIGR